MNTYICLIKIKEQSAKELKEALERFEPNSKLSEKMGGKIIGFYAT